MIDAKNNIAVLRGRVVSGRGVGKKTITSNQDSTAALLQAMPFPGTLNVVTDFPFALASVQPFDEKGKHFAVKASINGVPCLVCRWKGAPLHVMEIVSDVFLRDALQLKDDSPVEIVLTSASVKLSSGWRRDIWQLFYKSRPQIYYDDDLYRLFKKRLNIFHQRICQWVFEVHK